VRVHVGDGRDADARRVDDVDGLDADARTDVARAAASFLGMWVVMMVAMMLPSLVPMLWRYRQAVGRAGRRAWVA
jgi:predicted metal-binding membrane protein